MATSASVSKGTQLKIKIGSVFTKIAELKDFSGIGGGSAAVLDATSLDSTAKEKLIGLMDEGSPKFTFNYIPGDAGQTALRTARTAGTSTDFQLVLGGTAKTYSFSAFVLTNEITGGVDTVTELATGLEITGAVTEAATV